MEVLLVKEVFSEIHDKNAWKGSDSVSGKGSDLKQTAAIRAILPIVFEKFHVNTLLDIPCGDFFWFKTMMNQVALEQYIGADVVPKIIATNLDNLTDKNYDFMVLDAMTDDLPKVDMILCRDMLGHFSNAEVKKTLANFKRSGSKYLLATTFPGRENIGDIKTGEWRPINLASMFGLPDPTLVINENCTEWGGKYKDKSLGLWQLN